MAEPDSIIDDNNIDPCLVLTISPLHIPTIGEAVGYLDISLLNFFLISTLKFLFQTFLMHMRGLNINILYNFSYMTKSRAKVCEVRQ